MFTHTDPIWSAAHLAAATAETSTTPNESFVESFAATLVSMLSDEASRVFWRMMEALDPAHPSRMFCAIEALRALRYLNRRGLAASSIVAKFGSVEAVTLERLLLWAINDHGHVLDA